jgi:hypothetical protein
MDSNGGDTMLGLVLLLANLYFVVTGILKLYHQKLEEVSLFWLFANLLVSILVAIRLGSVL